MSVKLFSVVLLLLACSGDSVSERPVFEALEYLPALEYFLQVLQFSSELLDQLEYDPTLRMPLSVSKMVESARSALVDATAAAQIVSDVLGQDGPYQVQPVVEALYTIRGSLCDTNFHFPTYFFNQTLAEELEQKKSVVQEQVDSLPPRGRSLGKSSVGWDLQLVNSILTGSSSLAMSTTLVVRNVVAVERLKAYMNMLFIPPRVDEMVLQDLIELGNHARSYNGMYREALNLGSEMFLRVANEGNQVLYSLLASAPNLSKSLQANVESFASEVLRLTKDSLAKLQSTTNEANEKFTELFQNNMYASFGLESSAMAMLYPLPRNMVCVRTYLPLAHNLAGSRLTSLSLCNNDASRLLYEPVMQYREQLRQLQQTGFEKLQLAVDCDTNTDCQTVYADASDFFQTNEALLKAFTPDLDTYRGRLLECLTVKSEAAMNSIVDLALNFNYCLRRREAESELVSTDN